MKLEVIKNITEYLNLISDNKKQGKIWFRGQKYSEYQLEPSLFREKLDISIDEPYYKREKYLIKNSNLSHEKFKENVKKYKDCSAFDEIDYLYLMQHYGIPTRLLDFTVNELIALYFSVSNFTQSSLEIEDEIYDFNSTNSFTKHGSAVYCINPILVNEHSFRKSEIINLNEYNFESLNNIDFPICIKSNSVDDRIKVQEGVFVYYGTMIHPLDYYSIFEQSMTKIFIPNSVRDVIKKELKNNYNISHLTMFPDISGVSMEIIDEMDDEFRILKKNTVANKELS
ncbi:FRG domain-containing protein [Zhouia spongiae]|uniref:FRG domain-containing protein n=1 Tax=Zhouia spongiae TaxID=2202721 RepID=A0ABY3YPW0_9FLAO|nr:FRG domain-containing protein [Zhouia spongiae]UNY99877.1 FRG domain-containing protein [Zhouia spongiae]